MLIFLKWNGFLAIFVWQKSSFCRFYCSCGSHHQETLEITRWFNSCMRSQRHNRITFTFCTEIGEFVCTCHPCRPYRILPLFSSSRRNVYQPVRRFPQYNIMVRFVIFPKDVVTWLMTVLFLFFYVGIILDLISAQKIIIIHFMVFFGSVGRDRKLINKQPNCVTANIQTAMLPYFPARRNCISFFLILIFFQGSIFYLHHLSFLNQASPSQYQLADHRIRQDNLVIFLLVSTFTLIYII